MTARHRNTDGRCGDRIAACRRRQGWNQRELSRQCGGSPSAKAISNWEGGTEPRLGESFNRMAEVLRVSPGWLLMGAKGEDLHAYD